MLPRTRFTETEALLLTLDALDGGDLETPKQYLRDNFLSGELRLLGKACEALEELTAQVQHER